MYIYKYMQYTHTDDFSTPFRGNFQWKMDHVLQKCEKFQHPKILRPQVSGQYFVDLWWHIPCVPAGPGHSTSW